MTNSFKSIDFYLPSLSFLDKEGYFEKVKNMYQAKESEYQFKYSIFSEYPSEQMPIYIAYFIFYKHAADTNDYNSLKYLYKLRDDKVLTEAFNEAIPALSGFMNDIDIEPEMYEDQYKKYKSEQRKKLERDPKVIKFMQSIYNENVKRSIHSYFLTNGVLSFDKVDLELNSDETFALAEYLFYKELYNSYKTFSGNNPYYKFKFRKAFKKTSPENMDSMTYTFLNNVEEDLLTFEEYVDVITNRQLAMMEIITFSLLESEEYEAAKRTRIEVKE